ncbi:MAG: hypothetical protein ACRDNB_09235 [Gaiellaceae bacterium]
MRKAAILLDRPAARKVMHVERDTFVGALVDATLCDAGLEVDRFSTAPAALAAARLGEYDAFLLAGGVADADARSLAEELGQLDDDVPVVFITGDPATAPRCRNLSVLTTPLAPHTLVDAVRAAFATGRRAA